MTNGGAPGGERRREDLARIREALDCAAQILAGFTPGRVAHREKPATGDGPGQGPSPVTEADLAVDAALRGQLPRPGEGWLSEESADDPRRLACRRVWVVDPIDGTREFVEGVPDWCVAVGLVEDGRAVAGGVLVPQRGLLVLGAAGLGVTANGQEVAVRPVTELAGARILASRSETARGEWREFEGAPFSCVPTGSIAHKLTRVAIGAADGTWTRRPRREWDVAAGVALVTAAGGTVWTPAGGEPLFNRSQPVLPGLVAGSAALVRAAAGLLGWRTAG